MLPRIVPRFGIERVGLAVSNRFFYFRDWKSQDPHVESMEARMNDLQVQMINLQTKFYNYFMWGFGMVLLSIFGLVGFIVYDRRTTLAPVEGKTERIIKALRERAEKDPVLMEALKNTALW